MSALCTGDSDVLFHRVSANRHCVVAVVVVVVIVVVVLVIVL